MTKSGSKTILAGLVTLAMASSASAEPLASAAPPGVVLQTPGAYRFMVGDVRVTALSDGTVPIDLHALLRGTTPANIDAALGRSFLANPVEASINAFLVEIGTRRVLVDTGAGDLFGPGNGGKLVEALKAAGTDPAEIDDILITHVHTDHSGGLVREGRMIFTKAIVHAGKADIDFFLDPANGVKTGYEARYFVEAGKTLRPYVDAGRVKAFDGRARILPEITAEEHPGHTPGSAFYTLESRGERIVFVGDIVHVGAVQLEDPAITISFDLDQAKAAQVRQTAFAGFAKSRTLIAAPHLPFPGVGHIRRRAPGYEFVPVAYTNRQSS